MVVFDTPLFGLIALVSSVALVIAVPRQVRSLLAVQNTPPEADRRRSVTTGANLIPYLFLVAGSAALGTALNPLLGYDKVAELVKESLKRDVSVKELAVKKGFISKEEARKFLNPSNLTKPNMHLFKKKRK